MYLNQAKREPDWPQFHEAMVKEIEDHTKGGHGKWCQGQKYRKGTK